MLKELYTLVKMLFVVKINDTKEVKIINMNHFPFKGYCAMSWCGHIIHRIGSSDVNDVTINHENIHLCQARKCGGWCKYYLLYFWEWIKGNPFTNPSSSAYYTNPYEMEAYANECNFDYLKNMNDNDSEYSNGMRDKYVIKRCRKRIYKSVGGTSRKWMEYINGI